MSFLLVVKGYNTGVRYELEERTRIGRSPDNEIQLMDRALSRFHCRIEQRDDQFVLCDEGSTYGTLVNDKKINDQRTLYKNDAIEIGNTLMVFDVDYDLKNTRFGEKSIILGGINQASADTWASDIQDLPRISPSNEQTKLKRDLSSLVSRSGEDLPEQLDHIMQIIIRSFNSERAVLMLYDTVSKDLIPLIAISPSDDLPISRTAVDMALREKKAVVSQDVMLDQQFISSMSIMEHGRRSLICVPIFNQSEVLGIIYLDHNKAHAFSPEDAAILQTSAHMIAPLISKFKLEQAAEKQEIPDDADGLFKGSSKQTREILELVQRISPHPTTILIQGPTGVGKDVLAQEIHRLSPRHDYPFIALNCASIPDSLFESELFGHEKGSFTGANSLKRGKIELAHGGTLFLDEIGEMNVETQPKLLRFLQDRVFNRVGGLKPIQVDVRIIAATNRDLEQHVKENKFRWDLLFRLNVVTIQIPPLQERPEDIRILCDLFLKRHSKNMKKTIDRLDPEAMEALFKYPWPGNVRELENCIERAVLLCEHEIIYRNDLLLADQQKMDFSIGAQPTPFEESVESREVLPLKEVEKQHILKALQRAEWNQVKAAELLKIHRNTLRRKIQEYHLTPE